MNSVEIIVGQRWKEDVRYIHSLRARRPAETSLNLLELRDIIDIVIDGSNLTASIPEEAIFGLVGSLLTSLVDLVDQTSTKAIIEFHHEPWELVLVPNGSNLLVSLYSIDRRRQVVARDLGVEVRHFVDAICKVGEQLLTELFGVSDRFSSDPQVRKISQSLARLRRTPRIQFPPRPPVDDTENTSRRATTSSAGGLSLGYRIHVFDTALHNYRGEHVFDLHSLLFAGTLEAEFYDRQLILCADYPFLAMHSLLDRTRQLFNQLESHAHAPFVLDEPLAHIDLAVTGEGSRWILDARSDPDGARFQCTIDPADCLDILVSIAELFVQDLLAINPHLEVNHRFIDFKDEVEKLRQWHRDLCSNNLYHDRPEDYLRRLGHIEPAELSPPEGPQFPWPISSIHTLFPHRCWSLSDERIDFAAMSLTSHSVTLSSSRAIRCLNLLDGTERWRHDVADQPHAGQALPISDSLLVTTEGRRLVFLDRQQGSIQTQIVADEPWGELVGAARYDDQDLVVVGLRSGTIVAIDDATNTILWRHSLGPAELQEFLCSGPLVCCQSTEGVIKALNPNSGKTLWKIRPAGTPQLSMTLHQGRLYTLAHEPLHRGSTLLALYPYTGRTVWQVRLPGFACGPASFIDQWMLIPVERHGQLSLTAVDLEAVDPRANWRLELSSAGIDRPTAVLPVVIDGRWHGLVRTDRAELTCFAVDDGSVRWRSLPASETLLLHGNLPLFRVRDAVVNVARTVDFRHLATGRLLHSFSAIEAPKYGFLAPPFRLLLGEQAPDGATHDRLTAWSVEHFLALLD